MNLKRYLFITIILFAGCKQRPASPVYTYLYGYGQVEKLNGRVKAVIEKRSFSGEPRPFFTYTFDNKGNLAKISDGFNSVDSICNYITRHTADGKKKEAIGLYKDLGKKIKEVYQYDDSGHLIKSINNALATSPDTDRFFYDAAGNLSEHQQYFEKKPLWIFKYKYLYDKNNHCNGFEQAMTTWRDSFKTPAKDTSRYISFDSHNNWTKAIFLDETITRKITYY